MKKVLAIVSRGTAAEGTVHVISKTAGVSEHNLLIARSWNKAHELLEKYGVDAILLCDVLDHDLTWEIVAAEMLPSERKRTILFRVGLDESIEPYEAKGYSFYASVHGRTPEGKYESPANTLKRLLEEE